MKDLVADPQPVSLLLPPQTTTTTKRRFIKSWVGWLLVLVWIGANLKWWVWKGARVGKGDEDWRMEKRSFEWDDITASKSLVFHPCFDWFQCAKLAVPLDYFNGTHPNQTISIAITKLPARVPVNDSRYGGPLLINPGGPGGSGTWFALLTASNIQTIVDPIVSGNYEDVAKHGKYYDILGFDPRGVGETQPQALCMPDTPSEWSWALRMGEEGLLDSSNAALGRLWSMTHAHGSSCKRALNTTKDAFDIKQYISTASVARDMLEIAEKHADWVHDQRDKSIPYTERKPAKLVYWGFSYGTYLGATFASMFPDRVERLALDGVVNIHDYNNALGQGSLRDTEKDMKSFYTFCVLAGSEGCPLATPNATVWDVEKRVQGIIKSLYHNPLPISSSEGPEIITYSDVRSFLFQALYTPRLVFVSLAFLLAAIEQGGSPYLTEIARGLRAAHTYSCPINPALPDRGWPGLTVQNSILCGDGHDMTSLDTDDFRAYWHEMEQISPSAGSIWSTLKMHCAAWPIRPLYTLGTNDAHFGAQNTSFPLLWISNTADPVTPLRSGRIMAERFPGSALLIQDSAGHCSMSTPSICTTRAINAYFQNGTLPDADVVCVPPPSPWSLNSTDPDSPFYDPSLGRPSYGTAEVEDQRLMHAAGSWQIWIAEGQPLLGDSHVSARAKRMVGAARWYLEGKGLGGKSCVDYCWEIAEEFVRGG